MTKKVTPKIEPSHFGGNLPLNAPNESVFDITAGSKKGKLRIAQDLTLGSKVAISGKVFGDDFVGLYNKSKSLTNNGTAGAFNITQSNGLVYSGFLMRMPINPPVFYSINGSVSATNIRALIGRSMCGTFVATAKHTS